jgi:hypothetical protein
MRERREAHIMAVKHAVVVKKDKNKLNRARLTDKRTRMPSVAKLLPPCP